MSEPTVDDGLVPGESQATNEGLVDAEFYNIHDGIHGRRTTSTYLDFEERKAAEIQRAKIEGRKPDLENPPAVAGTPLVTERQRVDNSWNSNPSVQVEGGVKVDPVTSLPIDTGTAPVEVDTEYQEQADREAAIHAHREAGGIVLPDGTLVHEDGSATNPDGTPIQGSENPPIVIENHDQENQGQ